MVKVMLCIGALLGVHLVMPFWYWQHLLQQHIQQLSWPARNWTLQAPKTFVTDSQFTHSRYAIETSRSIEAICEYHKFLRYVILPALAEAFLKHKGETFGFDENSHSLSTMDQDKLGGPVHNLDAERSVGFINYEEDQSC